MKYVQICQGEYGGASWIYIRTRHGSLYGSYMDPYVDLIWVVYMQMCSQLIQNVNISLDVCTNVLGGLWEAERALREGSGKVREILGESKSVYRAGTEPAPSRHRAATEPPRGSHGGASAGPPCGHFYRTLIILPLEPSSELAIRE